MNGAKKVARTWLRNFPGLKGLGYLKVPTDMRDDSNVHFALCAYQRHRTSAVSRLRFPAQRRRRNLFAKQLRRHLLANPRQSVGQGQALQRVKLLAIVGRAAEHQEAATTGD